MAQPDLATLLSLPLGGPSSSAPPAASKSNLLLAEAFAAASKAGDLVSQVAALAVRWDQTPLDCTFRTAPLRALWADLLGTLRFAAHTAEQAQHKLERELAAGAVSGEAIGNHRPGQAWGCWWDSYGM